MLKVKCVKIGHLHTNCYLVENEEENLSFMVDPGGDLPQEEQTALSSLKNMKYILLTHGHFDHILAAEKYRSLTGAKVVISSLEKDFTSNANLNLSSRFCKDKLNDFEADIFVSQGDILPFGDVGIEVLNTPGHTAGSVCYVIEDMIFSGDTLFLKDCGRTDLPTGDVCDLKKSVKKLYDLNFNYKVYPGHGGSTFLFSEKNNRTGI